MAGRLHHHRPVRPGVVQLVAAASLAGCFYGGPINDRPSAEIRRDTLGEVFRGSDQRFRALLADPDGDALTLGWRAEACNEALVCESLTTGTDPVFAVVVPRATMGEPTALLRVHLDVEDSYGAVARPPQVTELPVANNPPDVDLYLPDGRSFDDKFPPGVPIVVLAGARDPDSDAVTFTWTEPTVPGSDPSRRRWTRLPDPPPSGPYPVQQAYQLIADVDGAWPIQVSVSDLGDVASDARAVIVEPDRAPCLGATDPAPAAGALVLDQPRRFSVLVVDDDLDPFPWPAPDHPYLGRARFRWSLRGPGATTFTQVASDVPGFELDPAQLAPGERIELRVEIDDRKQRTIGCGPDASTCSATGDACLQRMTWTLEVR